MAGYNHNNTNIPIGGGGSGRDIAMQRQNSTSNITGPNYSHNMDSFLSRFTSSSPSKSSYGGFSSGGTPQSQLHMNDLHRRPSGNLSKISFLYNNTFAPSSQQNSTHSTSNVIMSENNTPSSGGNSFNMTKNNQTDYDDSDSFHEVERASCKTTNEILACDRSWETPNLIAISTPRNLQLFKASETELSLEADLTIKSSARVKVGTISDLSFGHQQYGKYLAASTITGSIHLYHSERGIKSKGILTGHKRAVNSIDFNHVAPHLLASGSQDGKILVWDMRASNSKPMSSLNCNADSVRCCSFNHKKDNILAAVCDSGVVEKWDLRKPNTWERRINAHTGPALTVNWHPELDYIVTGGRDKQLQVWNLEPGFETREPSHVINTSGPISKAKWCKGRGNGSIMNTDIAVSFYNDDPFIQIWNLNRKFIPKKVIEGHSGPITQIVWRTPKHLISCSKDKTLIQYDVTKETDFIDNLPNNAFTWNPSQVIDFAFVKQSKSQFQGPFGAANSNGSIDTIDELSNSNVPPQNMVSNDSLNTGMQLYEMPNKSPGGNSPTFTSSLKLQRQQLLSRQPSYHKSNSRERIPVIKPPAAWVTPVHIPLLSNDMEKTKFLSTNYMIRIPEGADIIDVCEYNSMLATSVGHFRDSQTWSTIKTAIMLEMENEMELMKDDDNIEKKLSTFSFNKSESFSQSNSQLGTSYGSESDINNLKRREVSTSFDSEFPEVDENAIVDDDNEDVTTTISRRETVTEVPTTIEETSNKENVSEDNFQKIKNESINNDSDANSIATDATDVKPISIKGSFDKRRVSHIQPYRYSFTESSVDLDDEKHGSPLSLSLSSSPMAFERRRNVMMRQLKHAHEEEGSNISISKSVDTRLSRTSDNKSHLTAILKEGISTVATISDTPQKSSTNFVVPWNPSDLIKEACEYCCLQGDILMCATLAMLFESRYPQAITKAKSEEWIHYYHDHLLRCGYFANAATILRVASETHESFKTTGQTKTSVRTTGRQLVEGCGYCKEPVKGNAVVLIQCGHGGHFQCFRNWFVEQQEIECPCCGVPVVTPKS